MAVCTFLGHRDVYDKGLYKKLEDAVYKVAKQNKDVEFLFYNIGYFYDLCLAAVLDVKQHFPQKQISVTLVVKDEEREDTIAHLMQGDPLERKIPACIIDRVISPPPIAPPKYRFDCTAVHRNLERWAIRRSSHLISYVYFPFFEVENQQYRYAKNRGLTILDVTFNETAASIIKSINNLTEQGQFIIKKRIEGHTLKEIGTLLGVTNSTVQRMSKRACRNLRTNAKGRFQTILEQNPPPPMVCSIFAMGAATIYTLSLFKQTVLFLIEKYHVTQFRIAAEYHRTEYMRVLTRILMYQEQNIQIVAITHFPEMTQEDWRNVEAQFIPPCHAVENINSHGKNLRTKILGKTKIMIEQSDFCICNLSNHPLAASIQRHMSKLKGTKVFNIGKMYAGTE